MIEELSHVVEALINLQSDPGIGLLQLQFEEIRNKVHDYYIDYATHFLTSATP